MAQFQNGKLIGHNLPSDLAHRDPKMDLTDIDGGRMLDAVQLLPQSLRQMMQDNEMHVVLDANNRIVKIIKKRDSEFLDGQTHHFWLDAQGKRVALSEEQLDEVLGIVHDQEDVYNQPDTQLVGLESVQDTESEDEDVPDLEMVGEVVEEYAPPMDRWDVIFDATSFVQHVDRLSRLVNFMVGHFDYLYSGPKYKYVDNQGIIQEVNYFKLPTNDKLEVLNNLFTSEVGGGDFVIGKKAFKEALTFQKMDAKERASYLEALSNGEIEGQEDAAIYSADWFPPVADKRLRSKKAQELIEKVGELTKQNLAQACDSGEDKRPAMARVMISGAQKMVLSPVRGKTMVRAQSMQQSIINALRASRGFRFEPEDNECEVNTRWVCKKAPGKKIYVAVQSGEKKYLWDSWRAAQAANNGEIETPVWLFKKMMSQKLLKLIASGQTTKENATTRLRDAVKRIYPKENVSTLELIQKDK